MYSGILAGLFPKSHSQRCSFQNYLAWHSGSCLAVAPTAFHRTSLLKINAGCPKCALSFVVESSPEGHQLRQRHQKLGKCMTKLDIKENHVVSRTEWLEDRKILLRKEKEFTRLGDQLSASRCDADGDFTSANFRDRSVQETHGLALPAGIVVRERVQP